MVRGFALTRLDPIQQNLRDRCVDYLQCYNRADLQNCLGFLTVPPEREEVAQRAVADKFERGYRYERVQFREIDPATGRVTIQCDLVTKEGNRPGAEVRMLWKQVNGVWMIAEHP
jgi:hypothetical protein